MAKKKVEKNITLNDLTVMVNNGFRSVHDEMNKRFAEVDRRFEKVEFLKKEKGVAVAAPFDSSIARSGIMSAEICALADDFSCADIDHDIAAGSQHVERRIRNFAPEVIVAVVLPPLRTAAAGVGLVVATAVRRNKGFAVIAGRNMIALVAYHLCTPWQSGIT